MPKLHSILQSNQSNLDSSQLVFKGNQSKMKLSPKKTLNYTNISNSKVNNENGINEGKGTNQKVDSPYNSSKAENAKEQGLKVSNHYHRNRSVKGRGSKNSKANIPELAMTFSLFSVNQDHTVNHTKKDNYCVFCEHCNTSEEKQLEDTLATIKQAKSIISKMFDYISNVISKDEDIGSLFDKKKNMPSSTTSHIENFNDQEATKNRKKSIIEEEANDSDDNTKKQRNSPSPNKLSNKNLSNDTLKRNNELISNIQEKKNIESMLDSIPKFQASSSSLSYKLVGNYLNSLLDSKLNIESIVSINTMNNLKNNYLSTGEIYKMKLESKEDETVTGKISVKHLPLLFDRELVGMLDEKTKYYLLKQLNELYSQKNEPQKEKKGATAFGSTKSIKKSMVIEETAEKGNTGKDNVNEGKRKSVGFTVNEGEEIQEDDKKESKDGKETKENNDTKPISDNEEAFQVTEEEEESILLSRYNPDNESLSFKELEDSRRRTLIIYATFIQLISEVSMYSRERGVLLYKVLKFYFIEQERKNLLEREKLNKKIHYHKRFLDFILNEKDCVYFEDVDKINDVMSSQRVSQKTLTDHKTIVKTLFKHLNAQREQIYVLQSEVEIRDKELNTWIYDWQKLRRNPNFRRKLETLDISGIISEVHTEMSHKKIPLEEKSLLINSQKFLLLSSQSNYFSEQKEFLQGEIERLRDLFEEKNQESINIKAKLGGEINQLNEKIVSLQNTIIELKNQLRVTKQSEGTQTDVDLLTFNKMIRDHDTIKYVKSLNKNRFESCIERVKYQITKALPLDKKSLLYIIPELYNEKVVNNLRLEIENKKKEFFDMFYYNYLKDKFKIDKIIRGHIESTILGVLKYSIEDSRIDTFGRFLGIGNKLRREILDIFLIFLRNLPVSFYRLFDQDYQSYLLNGEDSFEIYFMNLNHFRFVYSLKYDILQRTKLFINGKEQNLNNLALTKKTQRSFNLTRKMNTTNSSAINVSEEQLKFDILLLAKFYHRSYIVINNLYLDFKNGKNFVDLTDLVDQFKIVNKEFEMSVRDIEDLFERHFNIDRRQLLIESFIEFFQNKSFSMKINLSEFVELTLNKLVLLFTEMERLVIKAYEMVDLTGEGFLNLRGFEKAISKIIYISEKNHWKMSKYFNKSLEHSMREVVSKEEFIIFCLNEMDIIIALVPKVRLGWNIEEIERAEVQKNKLKRMHTIIDNKRKNVIFVKLKKVYNMIAVREGFDLWAVPKVDRYYRLVYDE